LSTEDDIIQSITLRSQQNIVLFQETNIFKNEYIIDLSQFKKGVYFISIETTHGEIINKKVIKN